LSDSLLLSNASLLPSIFASARELLSCSVHPFPTVLLFERLKLSENIVLTGVADAVSDTELVPTELIADTLN